MVRISFIVPVYNCEEYIERCIKSILRQNINSYEIIIIDDGSTDTTGVICDKLATENDEVRVFHVKNGGVSSARNIGIQSSRGNYLAFIDADDYYKDDTITVLLEKAEIQNIDIICGDYTEIYKDGVIEFNRESLSEEIMDGETFVKVALSKSTLPMVVWLSLFRRSFIIDSNLYFKQGYYYEDELWAAQAYLSAKRMCYFPMNFYGYYIHDKSATHGKKYNMNAKYLIYICEELKEFSQKIVDQETKCLFQNYLVTDYLSGYYLGKIPVEDINTDFFNNMWTDKNNARKVALFLHAPHLYWYLNDLLKRIGRASKAIAKAFKRYSGYFNHIVYLIKKQVREYTVNRNDRKLLRNHTFSLISNSCNGGVITSELGEQFRSPTVNLYFDADDFIEFLEHFEKYIGMELVEVTNRFVPYPVGELGKIKIYFMHYKTFSDAKSKWDERVKRINFDNIFILMAQKNGCDDAMVARFDKLKYENKVIFTAKEYDEVSSSVFVKQYKTGNEVDILTDCIGLKGKRKYDPIFNYVEWLNCGGSGGSYKK